MGEKKNLAEKLGEGFEELQERIKNGGKLTLSRSEERRVGKECRL